MGNEWDTWKVGDRLQCKKAVSGCDVGDVVIVKYNGLSAAKKGLVIYTMGNGRDGGLADYSPTDNPSTYFFLIPATPTWQVGERVLRESINNHIDAVIAGAQGTIESVESTHLIVNWDMRFKFSYDLPLRHAYFSTISTGQSPKPVLQCSRCKEFNEYAEPNQPDGTHKCFLCRKYPYR